MGRLFIVVTGFGDFAGVKGNPTEHIVTHLQAYLAARGKALPGEGSMAQEASKAVTCKGGRSWTITSSDNMVLCIAAGAEIVVCDVLCVSGKAVLVFLSETAKKLAGLPLGSEVLLVGC